MDISEKVKVLLRSKKCAGKTQKDIADDIGIASSVLSKLCAGNSKSPSADTVLSIAKYFNVSTDWLLGNADYSTTNKATKELCKTLGLSDIAVRYLKDNKNQKIRDVINFLFGQHNDVETCQEDPRLTIYTEDYSLISELANIISLCKLKKDYIFDLTENGVFKLTIASESGDHTVAFTDNTNELFADYIHSSLAGLVAQECIERIERVLDTMFVKNNVDTFSTSYFIKNPTASLDFLVREEKTIDYYINNYESNTEEENAKKNSKR